MKYPLSMSYGIAVPLSWPSISAGARLPVSLSVRDFNLQRLAENRRRVFTLRFQRGSDSALTQQAFQPRPRNTSHGPDPVEFTRNAARHQPRLLRRWGRRSSGNSGFAVGAANRAVDPSHAVNGMWFRPMRQRDRRSPRQTKVPVLERGRKSHAA